MTRRLTSCVCVVQVPQIVAIFKSPGSRERHQRQAEREEQQAFELARRSYEGGEGEALLSTTAVAAVATAGRSRRRANTRV